MPSHLVEVLFQGVWSSLTGGWFYDTHLSLLINTVHMYTWFFLFALPFVFYIVFPSSLLTWFIYTTIISVLFTLIKLVNHQLNKMFDNNKIITTEKTVQVPRIRKPDKKRLKHRKPDNSNNNNNNNTSINNNTQNNNNIAQNVTTLIQLNNLSPTSRTQIVRPRNLRQRPTSTSRSTNRTVKSSLLNDTNFDTDTFDSNSMFVDYSLENESLKSKRSKAQGEVVLTAVSKRRRQTKNPNNSKANTSASFQMEDNFFEALDSTAKFKNDSNTPLTDSRPIDLNDTYFRSLSSPSKLTGEKNPNKSDEYEPVEYLMIDLEFNHYTKNRQQNRQANFNLTNTHLKDMSGSLNLSSNLETVSNRSLFKISEESLNNLPINSANNYMYISSKSANELKSKLMPRGARSKNETLTRKYKRIYSTIDSPKLAKKQMAKKKLHTDRKCNTQEESSTTTNESKETSTFMTCINLFDTYENSDHKLDNGENYYDIATINTPKLMATRKKAVSTNFSKSSSEFVSSRLLNRVYSDQTLYHHSFSRKSSNILKCRFCSNEHLNIRSTITNSTKTKSNSNSNLPGSTKKRVDIDEIRAEFLSLQQKLNDQMHKKHQLKEVRVNLLSIKDKLVQLADSSSHIPAIPLAPPPSLSIDDQKREYERQGAIPKQNKGSMNSHRVRGSKLSSSTNVYNKIEFVAKINSKIKQSDDCSVDELVGRGGEINKTDNQNENQHLKPGHHHIDYFSSELALSNEERMQLICDEYSEYYGNKSTENDKKQRTNSSSSKKSILTTSQYLSTGPVSNAWHQSPHLATTRNQISSASQAASAAVKLISRDILDRLTNRGPNRGVYRLDNGTRQAEASKLLEKISHTDISFNQYESFNPSINNNDDETWSSDEQKRFLMSNQEDDAEQKIDNRNNDEYYEEIDENFYFNKKLNYYNEDQKVLRPSLKQPGGSKLKNDLKPKNNTSLKLSKIRTVPSIRYFSSVDHQGAVDLPMEDVKQNRKTGEIMKKTGKQPRIKNNSLNNLELIGDSEDLTLLTAELKCNRVVNTASNSEMDTNSRNKTNQSEFSNCTYEEIMQTIKVDFLDDEDATLNPGHTRDPNSEHKSHYRISNSNSKINRRNRSSSLNNSSANYRRNVPSSSVDGDQRHVGSSGIGLIETASILSGDEYESFGNGSNIDGTSIYGMKLSRQAKRERISSRLRQLDRFETFSASSQGRTSHEIHSLQTPLMDLDEIIAIKNIESDQTTAPKNIEDNSIDSPDLVEINQKTYTWHITSKFTLQVPFDHYSLLAMLDRNQTLIELLLSIFISTLVSIFAALILNEHIYDDLLLILFCFIVASCHYSLLKSVQPDSSSPIHGFNSLTALSRPIYFCILCSVILLFRSATSAQNLPSLASLFDQLTIYGYRINTAHCFLALNFLEISLLFFPLAFTIGLCPQINTFILCVIEQIDMLIFGGTAMNNLSGAFISLARSLVAGLGLTLSYLTAVHSIDHPTQTKIKDSEDHFSKSVIFSISCGLLVLTSYFLSRQTSDLLLYLSALKEFFVENVLAACQCEGDFVSNVEEETKEAVRVTENVSDVKDVKSVYLSVPDSSIGSLHSNLSTRSCRSGSSGSLVASIKSVQEKQNISNPKEKSSNKPMTQKESNPKPPMNTEYIDFCEDIIDKKNKKQIRIRFESDLLIATFVFLFTFALHVSTFFSCLQPHLTDVIFFLAIIVGFVNHYILPQLRTENPWCVFSQPGLKSPHWFLFEPSSLAALTWFEVVHVFLTFFEKNCLNLLVILNSITVSSNKILLKFDKLDSTATLACCVISLTGLKLMRSSFCEPLKQYRVFFVAYLFHKFDTHSELLSETILIDLFVASILLEKLQDFLDKMAFIFIYTAPWQLPWGSAFHAFAQPLSVPHSAFLIVQVFISSLFSMPLMPLMGSAIFLLSYIRPVKFWEKSYRTKRFENSNSRLQSQLEPTTADSENLNAIFYEHLTSVLQDTLAGDIMLGRWGNVSHGDFFILSSDYLNCLVHIIEVGNGFVTFQLRGLEFKGTYCQQRELEAITEDTTDNEACCCCNVGHLKHMLSLNVAFHLRWVAWSVVAKKYIVNAYRIVDNDLSLIVNFFSLRRTLLEFYIKSAIYYLIKSENLIDWLNNPEILKEIEKYQDNFIDLDTCFDANLDVDFDTHLKGVTLAKFSANYLKWVNFCKLTVLNDKPTNANSSQELRSKTVVSRENETNLEAALKDTSSNSLLLRFAFAVSLLCRRTLNNACIGAVKVNDSFDLLVGQSNIWNNNPPDSTTNLNISLNSGGPNINMNNNITITNPVTSGLHAHIDSDTLGSFQHGYYTLFKGDVRIQSTKDEWVFNEPEILKQILIPAVRMGLKLHQDHFQNDIGDEQTLHENLVKFTRDSMISYERDPIWRSAVLNSVQSLLSLRHQFTEYSDQYKVVMLNKSFLSFRLITINKECVRSFWAGQQHELIFLRNKNQERGSIQNAKQVLRNIINSSCDQPIGYPIYVSPLTTSYASSHPQISKIIGPELKLKSLLNIGMRCLRWMRDHCTNDCSGSAETNFFQSERSINRQNFNVTYAPRTEDINFNLQNIINQPGLQKLDSEQTKILLTTTTPPTVTA